MSIDATMRDRILHLPQNERAALAHDLIASLDPVETDPEAESLWDAEIERRPAAMDGEESKLSDWRKAVEVERVRKVR